MREWLLPFLLGAATGVLSAWGVGGGTLLLLCMTLLLGVEQTEARSINLLYFLPAAAASLNQHRKNGCLDRRALRAAIPVGVISALAAALLSTVLDVSLLRRPFGLFLLYAGASLLLRKDAKEPRST